MSYRLQISVGLGAGRWIILSLDQARLTVAHFSQS